MNRFALAILLITSVSVFHCSNRSLAKTIRKGPDIIAWNEDSISPVILSLFKDRVFIYTIKEKSEYKQITGKYGYSHDTLWLVYDNIPPPRGFGYFLINSPGNYLIQNYPPGSKRLVLHYRSPILF